MRVGLYSIPATGTRFVASALSHLGADFSRRHVGVLPSVPEWRRIIPVRNPYDCYQSHMHHGFSDTDAEFIEKWANYLWRTQWMDAFYFPLDVPECNRAIVIQSLSDFCGLERDMDLINSFEWKTIGKTEDKKEFEPPNLEFAVEWYKHYTLHWGAKYRHSNNMISEGS
jgi:hypothetical protein